MPLFEPEEAFGQYWHRLVGSSRSYRGHPDAAVALDPLRVRLGLLFRASGGDGAIRIVGSAATASGHRLNLKQALGLGTEMLEQPTLDAGALRLPGSVDLFADVKDNEALYEWLAIWLAHAIPPEHDADPLRNDLHCLRAAARTTQVTLAAWPGLRPVYDRLRRATLSERPRRNLPGFERQIETAIAHLLNETVPASDPIFDAIVGHGELDRNLTAPRGYHTFLPVPLWGDIKVDAASASGEDVDEPGGDSIAVDAKRRTGVRKSTDRSDRGDPLMLHRFETIFSIAEMINVNRDVDDDDDEGARQALEDTPELTIGSNKKRPSARLGIDLDLAPREADATSLVADHTYPEWDWKRQAYRPDYCRVIAGRASEDGEEWLADLVTQRNIRHVRRQFEALRPRRQTLHAEPDGDELDLSMLIRSIADRQAGESGSDRIFTDVRPAARDLSVAVLMDVSLSTDAWLQERRVLDVEKGALLAFTHGLTACGDEHAIYTFTSRRRSNVTVTTLKGYDETLDQRVARRIAALKPGQYTRIGAAVRHVASELVKRPQRHRLLLLLTDGKPNDVDHYEGRYGIEDTRMAIREARKTGLRVFGITIDENARDYFPHIFGRGAFAIVRDIARLPAALPAIYRQLTT
ncbi:von Willebrand factor A [Hyphomicrobium denitrificans 1NES1]|uniref:von Willebrand factor A n=1 Tax=Hyphomicrobium denitrificans 1NES1 TaxID=670307 RepID=N0B1E5_9HYPH|nr:VWA domain-containing protein [Hyphomicrobium denitrificans]AGK56783.1 von Willebrand factor A [Hyphomicrobium denitrificans 1NES1]